MPKTKSKRKSRKRSYLSVTRTKVPRMKPAPKPSRGVSKKDIEEIVDRQTALLNPAAAAVDSQSQRVSSSLTDPSKSSEQRLRVRRQEIERMSKLRRIYPQESHSLSSIPSTSFPDAPPPPTKPEERPYHAVDPPPPDGEEVWTKPDETKEVQAKVFLDDSLTGLSDSVKDFGYQMYYKFFFDQVTTTPDGFKMNGIEINRTEYGLITSFIHNQKAFITSAPPKTRELLYYVANKLKESTKSLFRSGIIIPTKKEAMEALQNRLGAEKIKTIKNKNDFVEETRDQMLLENVRRIFFKVKSKSWSDTIANVLSFGTREKLRPTEEGSLESVDMSHVLKNIPNEDRSSVKDILTVMKHSDGLTWNEKGELTLGDSVLTGSDINRITQYLFQPDKQLHKHKPIGTDTFVSEMLKNQNMLAKARGNQLANNKYGGLSVIKDGVNVMDMTIKIANILSFIGIPWYGYLAGLMRLGLADFRTITSLVKDIPVHLTSNTIAGPVGEALSSFIEGTGNVLDNTITSPKTKAGVVGVMGYAYSNFNKIFEYVKGALATILAVLTYKQSRLMIAGRS